MPFVEVNGASIYYEVHGEGPAVVLSHGIVGDTHSFAPLIPAFATAYTVVVYDARGRGQSGDGPYAFTGCPFDGRRQMGLARILRRACR